MRQTPMQNESLPDWMRPQGSMGVGGAVAMIAYYPKVLKVKAGTTVTFVNKSASEVHNIVFGPKKYVEQWGKQTDMVVLLSIKYLDDELLCVKIHGPKA